MSFRPVNGGSITYLAASNGTDDRAAIQAVLDALPASGGIVMGKLGEHYKLSGSLKAYSNQKIFLYGCDVTLNANSNVPLIVNQAWVTGSGRDSNIEIAGGTWNHGANAGGAGQNLHQIVMQRVDGLYIHDLKQASTGGKFALDIYACTDFEIARINLNVASDGVHIEGACSNGYVHDIYGTTGDDSVAITPVNWTGYTNGDLGDVTDIRIEGVYTTSGANGVKVLSGSNAGTSYNVRRVWVKDVNGTFASNAVFLGGDSAQAATYGGSIYDIEFDGITNLSGIGAVITVYGCGSGQVIDNLVFKRVYPTVVTSAILFYTAGGVANTVGSCTVRDSYLTNTIKVDGGALVKKLVVEDCYFDLPASTNAITVVGTNSGITACHLRDCRVDHATVSGSTVQVNGTTNTMSDLFIDGVTINQSSWQIGDFGGSINVNVWIGSLQSGAGTSIANVRSGATVNFKKVSALRVAGTGITNAGTVTGAHLIGVGAMSGLTYSASITPDAKDGTWRTITVTNATAVTVNAPTNPPGSGNTCELVIEVLNSSGGAMGVITWNAAFNFTGAVWTNPANGKSRWARFEWNGTSWICTGVAPADY